jgi:hypothetical protein
MLSSPYYENEEMHAKNLSDVSNSGYIEDIEFFLADDIVQGEEVPFYLLWKGNDPKEIVIDFEGFKGIIEMHNTGDSKTDVKDGRIVISGFHIPGYLGGLLSTEISDQPFVHATLNVKIISNGGETVSLTETRKLYTTRMELVNPPEEIFCDDSGVHQKIGVNLRGVTTVFLGIEEMEGNEAHIDVPPDIKEAMEKFFDSVVKGMENLRPRFPNHLETIDLIIDIPTGMPETEYIEMVEEKLKEAYRDKTFFEAVVTVLLTALSKEASFKDRILRPLIEYFESPIAERTFFLVPLLHVRIPREGCMMAIRILGKNVLWQNCSKPLEVKVKIKATDEILKPLKDIFTIGRV